MPETTTNSNLSDIVTPEGVGIRIDNVNQSLWQYVKKRKLWQVAALVPIVAIWEVFIVFLFINYIHISSGSNSGGGRGFGYLIMLPFIVFSSWLYRIKKQFEDAFMEEFAISNGYSFDKNGTIDETYGAIFRIKGRQSVSDVVSGTYASSSLRLFLYDLTIGSGQNQHKYQDTIIEIDLHGQLPNLLMVNKHSRFEQLNLANSFGTKNTYNLEGDFNQYFTLLGQPNNQIEALEVFAPDTMALMEDESKHYSVEFSGNRIYIYANGFIGDTQHLTQVFALAKKLISKIAPLASRLQNDSAIISPPINIIQNRKAHPFATKFGLVTSISLTILGLGIMTSALFIARHQSVTNTTNAIAVSNKFMQDFGHGYAAGAEQFESPNLQKNTSQNQYLENNNFSGLEYSTVIDQKTGTDKNGTWVGVLYEYSNSDKPLYIKLILSKYGPNWRIWFFQSSYTKLSL